MGKIIFLYKIFNNIFLLALALVTVSVTNAQEVRVIDNKGTIQQIRNNQVTTADTAPTNPLEGDIWNDTSGNTSVTKTYNGTDWIANFSNVYVGSFVINSTGDISVTGIPFSPSQITFAAHANVEDFGIDSDNGVGDNNTGIANSFGSMNGFARSDTSGTITQGVIYVGGSGNSINDISRYSSNARCIGIRYGNQNGNAIGRTLASLASFDANGFTVNVTNRSDNLLVFFTAYR